MARRKASKRSMLYSKEADGHPSLPVLGLILGMIMIISGLSAYLPTTGFAVGTNTVYSAVDGFISYSTYPPSGSYGTDTANLVGIGSSYVEGLEGGPGQYCPQLVDSWLRFNLPSLPSGASVTSAKVKVYAESASVSSPITVYAQHCTDDTWSENGPYPYVSGDPLSERTFTSSSSAGWYEWDVTSQVQSEYGAADTKLTVYFGLTRGITECALGPIVSIVTYRSNDYTGTDYDPKLMTDYSYTPPATVPETPSLTATAGTNNVSLSWTAPSDGGSEITGYRLYWNSSTSPEAAIALGVVTSYSHTGLTAGTTYTYKVSAVNVIGEGANSSSAGATPTPNVTVPPAPTLVSANPGDGQVSLSWTSNGDGGSPVIVWAIIRVTYPPNFTVTVFNTTGLSYTDTNVTNGIKYGYGVCGNNLVGQGPWTDAFNATPTAAINAPSTPQNLTATAGNTQVSLAWTAPVSNGGAVITSYNVYKGTAAGSLTYLANTTTTSYTSTGLVNGVTYYFQVAAVNSAGEGTKAAAASVTPVAPTQNVTPNMTQPSACPYECCDATPTTLPKACASGKTCVSNKCVAPAPVVTESDADISISAAKVAIGKASKDGKNVTEAESLLDEAEDYFDLGKYAEAKSKAEAAKQAAEEAEVPEEPEGDSVLWVSLLLVGGIIVSAVSLMYWKKGSFKDLFRRAGPEEKANKEEHPKKEEEKPAHHKAAG